jgi:hypothetical protein
MGNRGSLRAQGRADLASPVSRAARNCGKDLASSGQLTGLIRGSIF